MPPVPAAALAAPGMLPTGKAWAYEMKYDGWRVRAKTTERGVTLWSRHGTDLTERLRDLAAVLEEHVPPGFTLDGEAIVWSPDGGRLDFEALQRRFTAGHQLPQVIHDHPATFVVFDVLTVAGHDTTRQPLRARRQLLEALAETWAPPLELSPQTTDRALAEEWFRTMPAAGIEGVMAKRLDEPYPAGRRAWVKVKHRDSIDVICAAITGSRDHPRELIVGLPLDGELGIVGRTGTLTARTAKTLTQHLHEPLQEPPWPDNIPSGQWGARRGEPVALTHVEPIVVEIAADTAWDGRRFRHTLRYLRPRPEVAAADVELPEKLQR
ncbi:ATP-dependent DNA ligase [Curtobacterium sp. MCSS17_016]|uniref:ATP-dependent DNA ligase n=1 Tax=Curtobacterium sp. MCSS17_016 TaxID=2175644 RepID=UPI000DA9B8D2|nr:ATP-dependent DNA ligase [Curtobacterium sp. MCSS17_016]WIE81093.1 ATP-dependent DNA ligase [Curtobacterium sp. MCSS17_016]